ncbi:WbqC-like family protein [Nitrosopumilaceae archaeon]|nr:WbqC-like family protein [Nitrosopumilaceae archaeon]
MTTVSIHQPGYLPWIGYFHKMMHSDVFVVLDDVQYERGGWQNRNRIKTDRGSSWLTVPVSAPYGAAINEVEVDNSQKWASTHRKSVDIHYSKCEFFRYWSKFIPCYENENKMLLDIDMETIKIFMNIFNINIKMLFSSELGITKKKSDLVLDICRSTGADTYISGAMGSDYLKLDDFEKYGISVKFQHVRHPKYRQRFGEFIPNLSALDLLLNEGPGAGRIIRDTKVEWK